MRRVYLIITLALAVSLQSFAEKVKIEVFVKNYNGKSVALTTQGKQNQITMNEENKGVVELEVTEPTWARFSYMGDLLWLHLYLTPGNNVSIELDANSQMTGEPTRFAIPVKVTCDDGGLTDYLYKYQYQISKSHFAPFNEDEKNLNGEQKVARFDEIIKHYEKEISQAEIPNEYKGIVNSFIKYSVANSFLFFIYDKMRNAQPYYQDDAYYKKLESLVVEVPELTSMRLYHEFLKGAIVNLYDRGDLTPAAYFTKAIKRVQEFNLQSLKESIIWQYVFECISGNGIEGTDEMQEIFLATFKDPRAVEYFNGFLQQYKGLAKGQPSPTFNYPDVDGKKVSLESLKGKYVYIDLWATWCAPCRAEMPHLEKLEHDYAGKNIQFVSISTDKPQDAEKWKNLVKGKNMGGVQLHANGDEEFTNAYKVEGIPRFILIDKEGNIVNADAPRPSSEEIRKLFDSLEGI